MYRIYNHSSMKMAEIKDNSVDLILTSPPYNISTRYGKFKDNLSLSAYKKLLWSVISECSRVIKDDGNLIIEVADSVVIGSKYILLAALIQKYCAQKGFKLVTRYINFIKTQNKIELPDHNMTADFISMGDSHSNCHQILVFSKKSLKKGFNDEVLYFNYKEDKDHPCPFPKATLNFLLKRYYKKNAVVLDPFCGTANLGVEVLKRGGIYYGYELNSGYCNRAKIKLQKYI